MYKTILIIFSLGLFISCNQKSKHIDNFNDLQRKKYPELMEIGNNDSLKTMPKENDLFQVKSDSLLNQ